LIADGTELKDNRMRMMLFKGFTGVAGFYHVLLGISGLILPQDLFEKVASLVLGINFH
jgi:hypothetical protein